MRFLLFILSFLGGAIPASAQVTGERWYDHAVIYEIYPRSFQDSNGDGIGDLNGVTQRLDYLKQLGVDAIWLTPFFPSPNADFGYDISDYTNVAPEYGTMADWDELVREARKRNIRVLVHRELLNWAKIRFFSGFDTMPECAMSSSFSFT